MVSLVVATTGDEDVTLSRHAAGEAVDHGEFSLYQQAQLSLAQRHLQSLFRRDRVFLRPSVNDFDERIMWGRV